MGSGLFYRNAYWVILYVSYDFRPQKKNTYYYLHDCMGLFFSLYSYMGTAAIIGIVIGSIIFIAIVVGLCAVCIFGLGKHRGSSGNVISPNTGAQSKWNVYKV